MADDLSQEEIDKMMQGGGSGGGDVSAFADIFATHATNVLSTSFGKDAKVAVKSVSSVSSDDFKSQHGEALVAVVAGVKETSGAHVVLLKKAHAFVMAGMMVMEDRKEEDAADLEDADKDSLQEMTNQITGAVATACGDGMGISISFEQAVAQALDLSAEETDLKNVIPDDSFQLVELSLELEGITDGQILQLVSNSALPAATSSGAAEAAAPAGGPGAQSVEFGALSDEGLRAAARNIAMLLDVPVNVTVELGRTNMLIKHILELTEGSIIELNKLAGEPVDLLVNDKLVASGEVVVIDENFGIRISSIIDQKQRIESLG